MAWFVSDIWHKYHSLHLCQISLLIMLLPILIDLYIINFIFFSIFRKITQCKNQLQENLFIVNAVRLSVQCWSLRHCGTLQHCGLFPSSTLCLPLPLNTSQEQLPATLECISLFWKVCLEGHNPMRAVSIKSEVASRFKKSNRLYAPSENIEISKP